MTQHEAKLVLNFDDSLWGTHSFAKTVTKENIICCDYIGKQTKRIFQQSIVAAVQKKKKDIGDDSSYDKGFHLLPYSPSHKETSLL